MPTSACVTMTNSTCTLLKSGLVGREVFFVIWRVYPMESGKRALPQPNDALSRSQPPMIYAAQKHSINRQPLHCFQDKNQVTKGGTYARKTFRQRRWVALPCCVTMATSEMMSRGYGFVVLRFLQILALAFVSSC